MKKGNLKLLFFGMIFMLLTVSILSFPVKGALSQSDEGLEDSIVSADLVVLYDEDANTTITFDGVISNNEYSESFYSEQTEMTVSMVHDGTYLYVGMEAPTEGYTAVGFNDLGFGMVGADVKYGYLNSTGHAIVNDYYARLYDFPVADEANNTDILESNAVINNGTMVVELKFVMASNPEDLAIAKFGIASDHELKVGESYALLYAWGKDVGMSIHHKKAIHSMFIAPPGVSSRTGVELSFDLTSTASGDKNTTFTGISILENSSNTALANKEVSLYMDALIADIEVAKGMTNSTGAVTFTFTIYQEYSSDLTLYARFNGDLNFTKGISNSEIITYTGHPEDDHSGGGRVLPENLDGLVPYILGIGSLAVVVFLWGCFAFVIYTVLFLNAKNPSEEEVEGGN